MWINVRILNTFAITMKQTTIGAIMSLTALLGGCDDNKEIELAGCDVGGLQARAIYR